MGHLLAGFQSRDDDAPWKPLTREILLITVSANLAMDSGSPSILMILVTATMIVKVPIAQLSPIWSLTVFHLLDFIIKFGEGPACLTYVGSAHGSNV